MCVSRWKEAPEVGIAPSVILQTTHEAALDVVDLADLKRHALEMS
jgi:uncharacterized protein (DUF2237 family)